MEGNNSDSKPLIYQYAFNEAPVIVGPLHVTKPIAYQLHPIYNQPIPRMVIVHDVEQLTGASDFPVMHQLDWNVEWAFGQFSYMHNYLFHMVRKQTGYRNVTQSRLDKFVANAKVLWVQCVTYRPLGGQAWFQRTVLRLFRRARPPQPARAILRDYLSWRARIMQYRYSRYEDIAFWTIERATDPARRALFPGVVEYATVAANALAEMSLMKEDSTRIVKNFEWRADELLDAFCKGLVSEEAFRTKFEEMFSATSLNAACVCILREYNYACRIVENERLLDELASSQQTVEELCKRGESCVVCMEEFAPVDEVVTTSCDHSVHRNCFRKHAIEKKNCILCRADLYPWDNSKGN